jgi:hypothetical protein
MSNFHEIIWPMRGHTWMSALVGGTVCAVAGPWVGLFLLEFPIMVFYDRPFSFLHLVAGTAVVFKAWIYAFIIVGPAACFVGAVGGPLLDNLMCRYRSTSAQLVAAALLGSLLGSALPLVMALELWILNPRERQNLKESFVGVFPLAIPTGIICAFLLFWFFRRRFWRRWCDVR